MKNALFGFLAGLAVTILVYPTVVGFAYSLNSETKACVSRTQLEEYMDDNEYTLLWRGIEINNKWLEVWTDFESRDNIIVEFDDPPHNNLRAIGTTCILAMTQGTTWDVKAMRKFIDWYEKLTKDA